MIQHILFDLDDTLYPSSSGLMQALSTRMSEFMVEQVGIPRSKVDYIRKEYWERYGTSLRGLYLERHIDAQAFLDFVHDVPVEKLVRPDARLGAMLAQLQQQKDIFTNAPADYAERVLAALGVEKYFTRIFDINFIEYESKPMPSGYAKVLGALNARANPSACVMIDDTTRNLLPAQKLGMRTVLLRGGPHDSGNDGADATIDSIYDLPLAINLFLH